MRLCGTVLNELEVQACQGCGGPLPPVRYLGYVSSHRDKMMGKQVLRRLGPACAREKRPRSLSNSELHGKFFGGGRGHFD